MNKQTPNATKKPGLIVAMSFSNGNQNTSDENIPHPYPQDDETKPDQSADAEEVVPSSEDPNEVKQDPEITGIEENVPNEQPEIDPLEHEDSDILEIDEDHPSEQADADPLEAPVPDLDEIEPDSEIDHLNAEDSEDNIDRDPTVQPGTDPMKTDNSQII